MDVPLKVSKSCGPIKWLVLWRCEMPSSEVRYQRGDVYRHYDEDILRARRSSSSTSSVLSHGAKNRRGVNNQNNSATHLYSSNNGLNNERLVQQPPNISNATSTVVKKKAGGSSEYLTKKKVGLTRRALFGPLTAGIWAQRGILAINFDCLGIMAPPNWHIYWLIGKLKKFWLPWFWSYTAIFFSQKNVFANRDNWIWHGHK